MIKWKRIAAGVYETTDGRAKVLHILWPADVWHFLLSDGNGNWDWAQTFETKRAAQDAARKELQSL